MPSSSLSSSSPLQLQQSPMASPATPSPPDPHKDPWYPYSNGAHFDSNIAMILIFIFCALVCALALNAAIRFFLRLSRQQDQDALQHHHQGGGGGGGDKQALQLSPLHSLPTLVFSSGTKMKLAGAEEEEAECAICLSEFLDGESVRILPKCKHGFHVKCIQGWLSSHVSCPTCRTTCLITSPSHNHHYDLESPPPPPPPAPPSLQLQPQLQESIRRTDRVSE